MSFAESAADHERALADMAWSAIVEQLKESVELATAAIDDDWGRCAGLSSLCRIADELRARLLAYEAAVQDGDIPADVATRIGLDESSA